MDDLLSRGRNRGLRPDRIIPRGRTISTAEVLARCPFVEKTGLRGGATWSDGVIANQARLFLEMLRWAVSAGGRVLNYVEAEGPLFDGDAIAGVLARDRVENCRHKYRAPIVVNCAGPWCIEVAHAFDRGTAPAELAELFHPSVALNLHLRIETPAVARWLTEGAPALAVTPSGSSQAYFLRPMSDGWLAGTLHACWRGPYPERVPTELVDRFLSDLTKCFPGLGVNGDNVVRVYWGILPAVGPGSARQAKRLVIRDHGKEGGPRGLISVSGVKLTTARHVAEQTVSVIARQRGGSLPPLANKARPEPLAVPTSLEVNAMLDSEPQHLASLLREIVMQESVLRLDDLLLRRTDWGLDPRRAAAMTDRLLPLLPPARGLLADEAGGAIDRGDALPPGGVS